MLYLGPFVVVEALTCVAGVLCITTAVIALVLNSSSKAAICGTAFAVLTFWGSFFHMYSYGNNAFPASLTHWCTHPFFGMPFMLSQDDWRKRGDSLMSGSLGPNNAC